ncbi:hypothetical protein Nepgr_023042 [Nepenthes gracilis]|uniref:Uncharacterized protein n=1 Tax=Nepenthes gracilis TaxID=150966 RepID=A0AAD3T0J6_NEPGR|nr:hypothetical protein Nepgr_023042 [Nepenthes gracilis]
MLLMVVTCLVSGMLINAAALVLLAAYCLKVRFCSGMQMESNWVLGLNQVLVSANVLAGWELIAVGICLEKDYFLDVNGSCCWFFLKKVKFFGCNFVCRLKAVLIYLDVESVLCSLVVHPDACIAGLGVWRVAIGSCFYVLLVSVVPCRATVEFCVSPNACCVLFC